MAEKEQPKEPEKPVYQRDLTAKEPAAPDSPPKPVKPKIKPRKVFVPKKLTLTSDNPMDHRVRNIRVSSIDAANLIRETIIDFQKELAEQPVDDPDKELHDREKVEKLFARLAKKYSQCAGRRLGGDLGWLFEGMKVPEELITQDLLDIILKTEKFSIPEPIRTQLGIHLILVCESRLHIKKEKKEEPQQPKVSSITPN